MLIELSQVHKGIGLEFKNLAPDKKKKQIYKSFTQTRVKKGFTEEKKIFAWCMSDSLVDAV